MPVSLEAQRAFERQIQRILGRVDGLTNAAVRRLLRLLEEARRDALRQMAAAAAGSFRARQLRALQLGLEDTLRRLILRYREDLPELLERAAQMGIDLTDEPFRAVLGEGPLAGVPALISRPLVETLVRYSADLITEIADVARRKINGILGQAAIGAVAPHEAIKAIAGELPGPSVFRTVGTRAETIYRTEVNRIFSVASQARMNQMADAVPGLMKEWLAVGDARTRPTHLMANGQQVPARGKFTVGGYQASFPRDPVLPAAESVNCRCHSIPVFTDEMGVGRPQQGLSPTDEETFLTDGDIEITEDMTSGVSETLKGQIGNQAIVVKPTSGLPGREFRPGITPGTEPNRERAAYLVNRFLGNVVKTPTVVLRNTPRGWSTVQPFLENRGTLLNRWEVASIDDVHRMGMFDAVIGNMDRHGGNALLGPDGRLIAIDHGLAFPPGGSWSRYEGNHKAIETASDAGALGLTGTEMSVLRGFLDKRSAIETALKGLISDDAIASMFERVGAMLETGSIILPG